MKRSFLLWFLLIHLCCGSSGTRWKKENHSLYKDFQFAEQKNFHSAAKPAFEVGSGQFGEKRYPCLVQTNSGSISFYLRLGKRPVLRSMLAFGKRGLPEMEARIEVESDYPDVTVRQYEVKIGRLMQLDLRAFEGRIVKVMFFARNRKEKVFSSPLLWMEPAITQETELVEQPAIPLQSFRELHKSDNLLIFVFDAASASHLGCYGYQKNTTPFIDSLAAQGVVYENAFTQAVFTLASTGSLLTGLYPDLHGVLDLRRNLSEKQRTIAEVFQDAGYRTAIFTANRYASPVFGYGQGFEHAWLPNSRIIYANQFVPAVTNWLAQVSNQRFFAYMHFREPHYPFDPPIEFLQRFHTDLDFQHPVANNALLRTKEEKRKIAAAYDANLAFADQQFGKILSYLKSTGLLEKTIVVVLADHGEAFWEHGIQGHNNTLYDEVMRVPLVLWVPQEVGMRGIRRKQLVDVISLFPTFVDLYQFSRKGLHLQGESFLPSLMEDRWNGKEYVISQTNQRTSYGIRTPEFKMIDMRRKSYVDELYHLPSDPQEKVNLLNRYPILASYYATVLHRNLEKIRSSELFVKAAARETVIDRETEEQLRALGYLEE